MNNISFGSLSIQQDSKKIVKSLLKTANDKEAAFKTFNFIDNRTNADGVDLFVKCYKPDSRGNADVHIVDENDETVVRWFFNVFACDNEQNFEDLGTVFKKYYKLYMDSKADKN